MQETTTNLLQCWFLAFQIFHPIFPKQYKINTLALVGPVAQRLEQRTHNPLVPGSNPGGPTSCLRYRSRLHDLIPDIFVRGGCDLAIALRNSDGCAWDRLSGRFYDTRFRVQCEPEGTHKGQRERELGRHGFSI